MLLRSALPPSIIVQYIDLLERKKENPLAAKDNIASLHENCVVLFFEVQGTEHLTSEIQLLSILSDVFSLCETVSRRYIYMFLYMYVCVMCVCGVCVCVLKFYEVVECMRSWLLLLIDCVCVSINTYFVSIWYICKIAHTHTHTHYTITHIHIKNHFFNCTGYITTEHSVCVFVSIRRLLVIVIILFLDWLFPFF